MSLFVAGAILGEGHVSLFVAGAILGEGQVLLFGEGQVSLFVAGAILGEGQASPFRGVTFRGRRLYLGEIWKDSRSARNVVFFNAKWSYPEREK